MCLETVSSFEQPKLSGLAVQSHASKLAGSSWISRLGDSFSVRLSAVSYVYNCGWFSANRIIFDFSNLFIKTPSVSFLLPHRIGTPICPVSSGLRNPKMVSDLKSDLVMTTSQRGPNF